MTNHLLTLTAIAQHLGVSRPTAYNIVRSVDFPKPVLRPTRKGFAKRWPAEAVKEWSIEQGYAR